MAHQEFLLKVSARGNRIGSMRHWRGQTQALSDFGLEWVTRSKRRSTNTISDSGMLVQLIDADSGQTIGGISIEFKQPGVPLPSEKNLADPRITRELEDRLADRPCELCDVWITREFRGRGLLPYIVYSGIAVAHLGGSRFKMGSTHEQVARLYEDLGIQIDYTQAYSWPDARYRTRLARIEIGPYLASDSDQARTVLEIARSFQRNGRFSFRVPAPEPEALRIPAGDRVAGGA